MRTNLTGGTAAKDPILTLMRMKRLYTLFEALINGLGLCRCYKNGTIVSTHQVASVAYRTRPSGHARKSQSDILC